MDEARAQRYRARRGVLGMYLYYENKPDQEFPPIFLAFMLMSPVMVVGSYFDACFGAVEQEVESKGLPRSACRAF